MPNYIMPKVFMTKNIYAKCNLCQKAPISIKISKNMLGIRNHICHWQSYSLDTAVCALFFSFCPTTVLVWHTVHTDTCGNMDLTQSSAITVKRCWHIHHPLSKRLIQSPRRDWLADSICSYRWHHWIKHCCYFSTHLESKHLRLYNNITCISLP